MVKADLCTGDRITTANGIRYIFANDKLLRLNFGAYFSITYWQDDLKSMDGYWGDVIVRVERLTSITELFTRNPDYHIIWER